ncbi:gamma carbonic anhydrase family protein [Alteribacter lacisalsi]|uniref:Gamma carbonic anhydrase family protein n=1 Tax=Alteribacter lacisalsi TaxID=2045244 RepID=A0A2W0H6D9_9BACI|nr:gamma carbonic anhydrase family protein [Alteribacter lacisalsi]PYZ96677.1 gamma carbonic anhydrase family protein [Alteribacter lacisalsi]
MNKYSLKKRIPSIEASAYVAPGAHIIGNVTLGKQSSIWFNAVLRGDEEAIEVGDGTNVQDGTIVHADPGYPVKIGKNVTVGHNATIHGCIIEDGALIGMGATVLNGAVIKKGAVVGAGALVPENRVIEENALAVGLPARPISKLSEEESRKAQAGADTYIARGIEYKNEGI